MGRNLRLRGKRDIGERGKDENARPTGSSLACEGGKLCATRFSKVGGRGEPTKKKGRLAGKFARPPKKESERVWFFWGCWTMSLREKGKMRFKGKISLTILPFQEGRISNSLIK